MNLIQISSNVIFIIIITTLIGENSSRLPFDDTIYMPVHYNINLTHYYLSEDFIWADIFNISNAHDFIIEGETKIIINILHTTKYIKLHQLNLKIRNKNILITRNGRNYVPNSYTYNCKTNIVEFDLDNTLFPGLYTFKIKFYNHIKENYEQSFSKNFYKGNSTTWLIAPYIQVNGIRQLFPCLDEPHLKATFAISMKHSRKFVTLSNMPVLDYHQCSDDEIRTTFFTTPLMSTFQIAIVLTNYQYVQINENIALWCERCSEQLQQSLKFEFAKRIIKDVTSHLKSEFNEIKIPKMDHIVIPNFSQYGTSKWGLIFHTEADLIYDEHLDLDIRKIEVARLIAPKIAYQWFGNVISPTWWFHFWINVGLATLYGEEIIVKIFDSSETMDFFIVQSQYESLHLDSFNMNPPSLYSYSLQREEIDTIFQLPRYMKVLVVLRMFQSRITEKVFREHVNKYLYRNLYISYLSYEFWSTSELTVNYGVYNISNLFMNWLQAKFYPIVQWTQKTENMGIFEQYYSNRKDLLSNWWITLNIQSSLHTNNRRLIELVPDRPMWQISHNTNSWLIIDITPAGYYRINYDSENWHKIAKYLNSTLNSKEFYISISVINRAKIIDDAFHLMMESRLNVSMFWELTQFLSKDTNYIAWYPMIKVLEYTSTIFPFLGEIDFVDIIIGKFKNLLYKPLRKELDFEEHLIENNITSLRYEIIKWACIFQQYDCKVMANFKLVKHLQDPKKNPVLPEWNHFIYCEGLETHNWTWSLLKNKTRWLETRDHKLSFLTCSEYGSMKIVSSSFEELFTLGERRDDYVTIRSYINIFHSIIMKRANTYYILEKIFENFQDVKPKEISTLVALTDIINYAYSMRILEKISQQVKLMKDIEELQLTQIQYKIQTRSSEIKKHIDRFQFMNVSNLNSYV